jgi:hypothetical protein
LAPFNLWESVMAEPDEMRAEAADNGGRADGPARREPELADLIAAWYEAARARMIARRRGVSLPPSPSLRGPVGSTARLPGERP